MKKLRFLLFAALAVLLLGLFVRTYNHAVLLPDQLQGTYVTGNGPFQVIFSAYMAREMFFYTDQANKTYIKGEIRSQDDGTYLLVCDDPDNAALLPDQTLSCEDLTLSLKVGDQPIDFQKIDAVPTIIGLEDRYS